MKHNAYVRPSDVQDNSRVSLVVVAVALLNLSCNLLDQVVVEVDHYASVHQDNNHQLNLDQKLLWKVQDSQDVSFDWAQAVVLRAALHLDDLDLVQQNDHTPHAVAFCVDLLLKLNDVLHFSPVMVIYVTLD